MSLSRIVPMVALLLVCAAAIWAYYSGSGRPVEALEIEPLRIPLRMPANRFLESRVAEIAAAEIDRVAEGTHRLENPHPGSSPVSAPTVKAGARGADKRSRLERLAAGFVYTRYGKVGDKGLATLMDLSTYETTTKSEGSAYHGLSIARIEENSILLTYPGEGELRKPRIELEVEPLAPGEEDPEKAQALWTRHRELWGNRAASAGNETDFTQAKTAVSPEEVERREAARRTYLEKIREFHERLESEDPTLEPGDSPLLPTAEEVAQDSIQKAQDLWRPDEALPEDQDSIPGADQP